MIILTLHCFLFTSALEQFLPWSHQCHTSALYWGYRRRCGGRSLNRWSLLRARRVFRLYQEDPVQIFSEFFMVCFSRQGGADSATARSGRRLFCWEDSRLSSRPRWPSSPNGGQRQTISRSNPGRWAGCHSSPSRWIFGTQWVLRGSCFLLLAGPHRVIIWWVRIPFCHRESRK